MADGDDDDVDMDGGISPLLEYSLHDLVKGYRELLAQLEQFSDFLAQQHKAHLVELRSFRRRLKAELTALEKVKKLKKNIFFPFEINLLL
jgi:hypothetical protein